MKTEFIFFCIKKSLLQIWKNKVSTVQTFKEGDFKESYNTQSRKIS